MWMVCAAKGGVLADEFREKGVVAIGWEDVGDLSEISDRHEIIDLVRKVYPDKKPRHNLVSGSQIYRFRELMDQYLPTWRLLREELNRGPLAHEEWEY